MTDGPEQAQPREMPARSCDDRLCEHCPKPAREITSRPNLDSDGQIPSSERMPWWANSSEMVTAYPELRVRCRVQSGRPYGATYVVWVGQRVVFHGWRPNKRYAWRAVNHYLDDLNVAAEVRAEIVP